MENKELYDKYNKGSHWHSHPKEYAENFSKFLKENDFQNLLIDAGCGNGRDVNVFQKQGFDVLGIDISSDAVEGAQSNFPECKFEIQDIENLRIEDESVSAFFIINVVHYLKKKQAIAEIHRTLKKDGYLLIHFNLSIIDEDQQKDYEDSEGDIKELFEEFHILDERIIKRIDTEPKKHTHTILELLLKKK